MLTKPRPSTKPTGTSMYSPPKGRISPLVFIGVGVTLVIALIGVGVFTVTHINSHAAALNPNCTLIIPPNPLSAQGLATPYQLVATDPAAGPCNEANAGQSAFVQAVILDPNTGAMSAYEPPVIDQGTQPAVKPVTPTLPRNAIVGIWFGDNATILTLQKNAKNAGQGTNSGQGNNGNNNNNNGNNNNNNGNNNNNHGRGNNNNHGRGNNNNVQANTQNNVAQATVAAQATTQNNVAQATVVAQATTQNNVAQATVVAAAQVQTTAQAQNDAIRPHFHFGGQGMQAGNCVNGTANSPFGQFSYCNAPNFFRTANALIRAGKIKIPALGTGSDGQACPTVRSFSVVDMDQSDNVQTQYLANANGQIAQLNVANQAALAGATTLGNPSDNALVSKILDPALNCTPITMPDQVNPTVPTATLATDELEAAADQKAPVALVPGLDEMVLVNGQTNLGKVNLYRVGVDQTPAASLTGNNATAANTTTYCQNIVNISLPRLNLDMTNFAAHPSPDGGATANSLFTFLANRLNATLGAGGLNCVGLLNIQNPVTLTTDGNGVVTAATILNTPLPATATTTTTTTTTGVQQVATGTATINLNVKSGKAQVALSITYPNHPKMQINANIVTDSCTGTSVFTQLKTTNANSMSNVNTTIKGLQGLTTVPANWFFTVTDPQQNNAVVGCGSVTANGTTGTATLGTVNNVVNAQVTPVATTTSTLVTPVATTTTTTTQATPAAATTNTMVTPVATTTTTTVTTQATPVATTVATQATPVAGNQGNTNGSKKHKH